jgi:hypothetical protein
MLPTTLSVSSAQMTTPGAAPDVSPKADGLPASSPFKDLLLQLHTEKGATLPIASSQDPIATAAETDGSSADISALTTSAGSAPLPALQVTSSSPEKDAVQQDVEPQQSVPCVPQPNADELRAAVLATALKDSETGKSDHKKNSLDSTKDKQPPKRIATSGVSTETAATIPADVLAMKAIVTTGDASAQTFPGKPVLPTKSSAESEGSPNLLAGIARAKSNTTNLPAAITQQPPQGSGFADQVDQAIANLPSSMDGQNSSHDAVAVEPNTKVSRVSSFREPSFVAASTPPAVVFHASLVRETKSFGQLAIPHDEPKLPGAETLDLSTAGAPVNHLDLQWKDGALGSISVRAEMREGALHAIVNGAHITSVVSTAELHQFLEESRIPVHSLQVNGVAEVKHIADGGSFDANASAGNGSQASLSYGDEGSRSSAREGNLRSRINEEDEEAPAAISPVPITLGGQAGTNRLSIHI